MSVFKCSKCGCKENTACCNFWLIPEESNDALCSECDPKIGKWHNFFQKTEFSEPYDRSKHGPLPERFHHK